MLSLVKALNSWKIYCDLLLPKTRSEYLYVIFKY
jgi:hypothetical protein